MAFLLQKEPKNAFTTGLCSSRVVHLLPHGYAIQRQNNPFHPELNAL
jgi:hypothetical protein